MVSAKSSELKVLKMGMIGEPSTLNPTFRTSTEDGIVNALIVRSASHFNGASELVPHLAKRLPVFKKNDLHFEIKDNAKWNDGNDVTCEDFQTGVLADHKFRSPVESKVNKVAWDAKDPKHCIISFNLKKPIYTVYLAMPLPTHIEKKVILKTTDELDFLKKSNYTVHPTMKGLSNGPYQMVTYKPGYYFEYERNPFFYGKAPYYDKLQVRYFKDLQSMINAYQTNEIDMIIGGLTSDRSEEVRKIIQDKKRESAIFSRTTTKLTHLEFNFEKTPTNDIRFRKALSLMIDPKEIAQLIGDDGEVTGSVIGQSDPLYEPKYRIPQYRLDKKKALKLLAEIGYNQNKDGQWMLAGNQPLSIDLHFNSENWDREKVAQYLQNKWASLGIKVNLKKNLKRILRGDVLKKGDFDVALYGWSLPKLQINAQFHIPERIPSEKNKFVGANYTRWTNQKAIESIRKADVEFEIPKIKKHLELFLAEFRNDMPWLPLYFEKRIVVLPKMLKNFQIFPDWEPETYDIENWK